MLIEMIEIASGIIGTGTIFSAISYRLGKNKGLKEAPKPQPNLEKELQEVEEFLDPYKKEVKPSTNLILKEDLAKVIPIATEMAETALKSKEQEVRDKAIEEAKALPIYPWKWERWDPKIDKGGVRCPKCGFGIDITADNHPKYCECIVGSGHFHLICTVCKFEAIYETAETIKKKESTNLSDIKGYVCTHCNVNHLGIDCPYRPKPESKSKKKKK